MKFTFARWVLVIFVVLASGAWSTGLCQQLDVDPSIQPPSPSSEATPQFVSKPLQVTVTKTLYLPPAMYGQWNVTGVLKETNAPEFFRSLINDIWVLERVGDQVIVSNPTNGASAAIQVDKVEGETATFFRMVTVGNKVMYERPTITVNRDSLFGISINQFDQVRNGRVVQSRYGKYELEAHRIGGARLQFKPEVDAGEPDIEIEEVQHGY